MIKSVETDFRNPRQRGKDKGISILKRRESRAMFNVELVRRDFPILQRTVHNRPLVYLDNAATSQKPLAVTDAIVEYYQGHNANVHRSIHTLGDEATTRYEMAREKTRRFINAPAVEGVVFTRNATEAINLVAHAWGRQNVREGDEIVLSVMEHHSNLVPWQMLAQETGATLRFIDIDDEGLLRWEDVQRLIGERTKLVALTQMSNVLGTINPIREIAEAAHAYGALMLVDGAQSVPHMPVDVQDLDCDFLAFSSHKMLGPMGVGILYARPAILDSMPPFLGGGHMISHVGLEEATYNVAPWRFEAGTPDIGGVVGFGAAIDYLEGLSMEAVRQHDVELTDYAMRALEQIRGVTIYGSRDASMRGGALAFNYEDIHGHDVGTVLDSQGIAVRAGHHCAQPLMKRLGVEATARASFYVYNRREEVDALADGIRELEKLFGEGICALPRPAPPNSGGLLIIDPSSRMPVPPSTSDRLGAHWRR
jgi:cysteine desulfurase/selenocysteine lyase